MVEDESNKPNFVRGLTKLDYLDQNEAPIHSVLFNKKNINFFMLGEQTEFRVRTIMTKEPETIALLLTLSEFDCFWDIGSNIGIYSLLAASSGCNVISIEPSAANFYILMKNILINKFANILALPLGLSNHNGFQKWNPDIEIANADNQISQSGNINCGLTVRSIDSLVYDNGIQSPTHLKIDVDSIEKLILEGGQKILNSKKLRFIHVEVDESNNSHNEIIEFLKSFGFTNVVRRHPPYYDDYYYAPSFNYFFTRGE